MLPSNVAAAERPPAKRELIYAMALAIKLLQRKLKTHGAPLLRTGRDGVSAAIREEKETRKRDHLAGRERCTEAIATADDAPDQQPIGNCFPGNTLHVEETLPEISANNVLAGWW